jgi:hypothetical protein
MIYKIEESRPLRGSIPSGKYSVGSIQFSVLGLLIHHSLLQKRVMDSIAKILIILLILSKIDLIPPWINHPVIGS